MILGKIVGTIVTSTKADGFEGVRYLLVDKSNQRGETKGDYIVALDLIGANHGELVMISESTSARETLALQCGKWRAIGPPAGPGAGAFARARPPSHRATAAPPWSQSSPRDRAGESRGPGRGSGARPPPARGCGA